MPEMQEHFPAAHAALTRQNKRSTLPPLPLAGEGWGEGGVAGYPGDDRAMSIDHRIFIVSDT